ncbi:P-II family nitrogen regulator [Candidatus Bathyarchaeota archaeon]|nr:P-II family nitrogen regulator [Candidatus Bathyarchaeota archaeon]
MTTLRLPYRNEFKEENSRKLRAEFQRQTDKHGSPSENKNELVVSRDDAEEVMKVVRRNTLTGKVEDAKIIRCPVTDAVRVRTGERGYRAV